MIRLIGNFKLFIGLAIAASLYSSLTISAEQNLLHHPIHLLISIDYYTLFLRTFSTV